MDFEQCCQILELTVKDIGTQPTKIHNLTLDQLSKLPDLIKNQYKKLSLKRHPDKGGTQEEWNDLVSAYEEATKIAEDLIKVKKQPHSTTLPPQTQKDWFQYFFNGAPQQQTPPFRPQNQPGDPRNWFSYDDDYSVPENRETRHQRPYEQEEEHADWFTFLNEKIFNSYRSVQNSIEKFHSKVIALNQKLEEEYQAQEKRIYEQAFYRYQLKKPSYYNEFKKGQYENYVTQFSHAKEVNKNKIIQTYQPLINRSTVWINLGFAFCFLGFPLLLSFFQWQNKRKLESERDRLLQTAEQEKALDMSSWVQGQGISMTKWEQQYGFKSVNVFKIKFNATLEGIEAANACKILQAKLINKKLHNQRIAEEVKGMQISVADGEGMLEHNLLTDEKPRHFANENTRESDSYGFRM